MQQRQAPQDLLQPNEVEVDSHESHDEEVKAEKNFSEVKLCTKHAALLRQKGDGSHWLYFSTQNSKVRGETPRQKLKIQPSFVKTLARVIERYPRFVQVRDLVQDPGLVELLAELAYLQVLVVN